MKKPIAPIIHRLMRELEDGSVEVAGYQKLEGGRIYHLLSPVYSSRHRDWKDILNVRCDFNFGCEGHHRFYIFSDRIDRDTGITLNDEAKTKVFERDILSHKYYNRPVVVRFKEGAYHAEDVSLYDNSLKIVGIEGVHKTEEGGKHETDIQS